MSRSHVCRLRLLLAGSVAAAAVVAVPGATVASAAPAAIPSATANDIPLTVELTPSWLPDGYEQWNHEEHVVPSPTGGVSFIADRYTDVQPDGHAGAGVIYVEVTRGGLGQLAGSGDVVTPTVIDGRAGVLVQTGDLRELRFTLTDTAAGVLGTVGALGDVTLSELRQVAENLIATPIPAPADPPSVVIVVPGDQTGSNTNMKGTGFYYNDWSTDGANAQLSRRSTDVYQGNSVGVWQGILWSDDVRYLSDSGTNTGFYDCDVTGRFLDATHEATRYWQNVVAGLAGDGIVGINTWSAADNKLTVVNGQLIYRGTEHSLYFQRSLTSPGNYTWSWAGSNYRYTGLPDDRHDPRVDLPWVMRRSSVHRFTDWQTRAGDGVRLTDDQCRVGRDSARSWTRPLR